MSEKFQAGEAGMTFTGNDAPFQKTADRVEKTMAKVAQSMEKGGDSVEGFIVNVREYTILTRMASGLKQMGEAAEKMSVQFRLGKASGGELFEKIAEGIPIIGDFITAGRGIHEAITGEKAYTEVLKQQTEEQEKRTQAIKDFTSAMKQLARTQDDLTKDLTLPKGLGFDISTIFTKGQRESEDAPEKVNEKYQKAANEIRAQKAQLQKVLQALNEQNHSTFVSGGEGVPEVELKPSPELLADIANAEKSLKFFEDKAAALDAAKSKVISLTQEKAKVDAFSESFNVLGKSLVEANKHFGEMVNEVYKAAPKIHEFTQQVIEASIAASTTAFDKLRQQAKELQADFSHGLIPSKMFDEAEWQNKTDTVAAIFKSFYEKIRPPAQTTLHFIDSLLGAPVERIGGGLGKAFDTLTNLFGGGKGGSANVPPPFRANFVGLEQLGSNIQQGAGSLTGDEQLKVAKQQLDQEDKNAKSTLDVLGKIYAQVTKGIPGVVV